MHNTQRTLLASAAFCLPAFAATTVTPGPWDLYYNSEVQQAGFSSEAACVSDATARNTTRMYTCRTRTTVDVTATTTPPPAPAPPPSGSVTYTTNFDANEFPISEGGKWRKSNNPWTSVRSEGGTAYGSNGVTNTYDDSYAMLSGFGPDQTVEATVQRNAVQEGSTHEVELHLRKSDDTNNSRGYEVLFDKNGQVQVFLWNGPWASKHTPLNVGACSFSWTPATPLRTGDVVKARIIGSRIEAWINGRQKACSNDSTFASGQPGIGFFIRPGGAANLLTLTRVTVTSN